MRVLLLRHAEPLSALSSEADVALPDEQNGLSSRGVEQTAALQQFLQQPEFLNADFHCSPVRRARETWLLASQGSAHVACWDARLAERHLHFTSALLTRQMREQQISAYLAPQSSVEGAESVTAHRCRVQEFFTDVIDRERASARTVVVVAHGGTIEHLLGCFLGSLNFTLSSYFTALPCAAYHEITSVVPRANANVWRIDRISAELR